VLGRPHQQQAVALPRALKSGGVEGAALQDGELDLLLLDDVVLECALERVELGRREHRKSVQRRCRLVLEVNAVQGGQRTFRIRQDSSDLLGVPEQEVERTGEELDERDHEVSGVSGAYSGADAAWCLRDLIASRAPANAPWTLSGCGPDRPNGLIDSRPLRTRPAADPRPFDRTCRPRQPRPPFPPPVRPGRSPWRSTSTSPCS